MVRGLGGDDTILVNNNSQVGSVLGDGGSGANPSDQDNIVVQSSATSVDGGRDDDTITVELTGTVGTVSGGTGDDTIIIEGTARDVRGGAGNDTVHIYCENLNDNVYIQAGEDTGDGDIDVLNLYVQEAHVTGDAAGGFADIGTFQVAWGEFEQIWIHGTDSGDVITIQDSTVDGIRTYDGGDNVTIHGTVLGNVDTGFESDTVTIFGTVCGSVNTGGGGDVVTVNMNALVQGTLSLGDGINELTVEGWVSGTDENGNSIITGAGNDTVNVTGDNGLVEGAISLGEGDNSLMVDNDNLSWASYRVGGNVTGGAGIDTITLANQGSIQGNVELGGGTTSNTVTLQDHSSIGGAIISTATGYRPNHDTVNIYSGTRVWGYVDLGGGNNEVLVEGEVLGEDPNGNSIITGDLLDEVTVQGQSGYVQGNVSVGDGSSRITVNNSWGSAANWGIGGNVTCGLGNDMITLEGRGKIAGDVDLGGGRIGNTLRLLDSSSIGGDITSTATPLHSQTTYIGPATCVGGVVDLGDAPNIVYVNGKVLGKDANGNSIITGDQFDDVTVVLAHVAGNVILGDGDNRLTIDNNYNADDVGIGVLGNVTGGTGSDTIIVTSHGLIGGDVDLGGGVLIQHCDSDQ